MAIFNSYVSHYQRVDALCVQRCFHPFTSRMTVSGMHSARCGGLGPVGTGWRMRRTIQYIHKYFTKYIHNIPSITDPPNSIMMPTICTYITLQYKYKYSTVQYNTYINTSQNTYITCHPSQTYHIYNVTYITYKTYITYITYITYMTYIKYAIYNTIKYKYKYTCKCKYKYNTYISINI